MISIFSRKFSRRTAIVRSTEIFNWSKCDTTRNQFQIILTLNVKKSRFEVTLLFTIVSNMIILWWNATCVNGVQSIWRVYRLILASVFVSDTTPHVSDFQSLSIVNLSQMLIIPDQSECQRLIQTDHVAQYAYTFKGQMYEQSS